MGALEPIIHSGNMASFFSSRTSIILLFRVLRLVRSWKLVGLHIDNLFVLVMLCSYYEVLLPDAQQSTQVSHLERLKDNQPDISRSKGQTSFTPSPLTPPTTPL